MVVPWSYHAGSVGYMRRRQVGQRHEQFRETVTQSSQAYIATITSLRIFFRKRSDRLSCARRLASRHPGRTHSPAWSARKYAKGFGTPHTSITLPAGWRRRSYAASVAACASASVSALPEFGVPQTWRNHIRFSPAGSRVRCSAGSLRVATPPARLEPLTMLGS